MKFYIIIQGSNDLNNPLNNSLQQLLKSYKSIKHEVIIAYSLIEGLESKLWKKNITEAIPLDKGIYKIINSELFKSEYNLENSNTSLDIKKFLELYYDENETNILIISGHGGVFQSMLDMSISPAKSISTVKFCNDINTYKFKLVFLDMCSMNYIELIYEILYNNKIDKLITYKNFAKFEGINYKKTIEYLSKECYEDFFRENKCEMIVFDKESFRIMKYARRLQSKIGEGIKKEIFTIDDKIFLEFEEILDLVPVANSKNINLKNSLRYIKYPLCDDSDKSIYEVYRFTQKNEYKNIIVGKDFKGKEISYITLEKESLLNIISMHNPLCNLNELEEMLNFYASIRNEK